MTATATDTLSAPAVTVEREKSWRPSAGGWAARYAVLLVIFGGLFLITGKVPQYWADRISLAAIYAIIGLSLNIVLGYIGQVSLGHHAFVGVAAYTSAAITTGPIDEFTGEAAKGSPFVLGMIGAVLVGALSAGLLGLVALRIKGLYLALITLTYGFVAVNSIFEIPSLTGGGAGAPAPRPGGFETDRAFAYLALAMLALCIYIDWRVISSKVGRAILSIKHSEPVAASYAINVTGYKVLAFVLSGAFAGVAGSLFAHRATTVVANDFQFATALLWVLMVVVGGLGRRTGVVIGSAFFALFPFFAETLPPLHWVIENVFDPAFGFLVESDRLPAEYALPLGAALALLTIIQYPGGIGEQLSPITRWLGGKKFTMHAEGHGSKPKHKKGVSLRERIGLSSASSSATVGTSADEIPASVTTVPASSEVDKETTQLQAVVPAKEPKKKTVRKRKPRAKPAPGGADKGTTSTKEDGGDG